MTIAPAAFATSDAAESRPVPRRQRAAGAVAHGPQDRQYHLSVRRRAEVGAGGVPRPSDVEPAGTVAPRRPPWLFRCARDGALKIEEMQGDTFTISNGGASRSQPASYAVS